MKVGLRESAPSRATRSLAPRPRQISIASSSFGRPLCVSSSTISAIVLEPCASSQASTALRCLSRSEAAPSSALLRRYDTHVVALRCRGVSLGSMLGPSSEVKPSNFYHRGLAISQRSCVFSWNRNPATGLMCIQSGPRGDGSRLVSEILGGRDWNAGCGNDRQDTPSVFIPGQIDQGDLSRAACIAQGRAEGHSVERDRVPV